MRMLGGTAKQVLLGGLLLSFAATVALMVLGDDRFVLALLAMGGFGLPLTALPAVVFLYSSRRGPPLDLPRGARVGLWFSGVALVLLGALLVALGASLESVADRVLGVVAGLIGIAAIVARLRYTPPEVGEARLPSSGASVVGAVLCFLVAVTIPKFACGCGSEDKTFQAELKSDLRNLAASEAMHFSDHRRYASREDLERARAFFTSRGDSLVIVQADSAAWYALGEHEHLPWVQCGIWVGARPADGMHDAGEGVPTCWKAKTP